MAAGIIVLRWVPPDQMGVWQALLLIRTYALIVQGGVLNGLNRELPFQLGAEQQGEVLRLAGTAQVVALFGSALLGVGGLIVFALAPDHQWRWGGLAMFFACAGLVYRNYVTVTYRAKGAFETLAKIHLVEAVLSLATLVLVWYYQFAGLAARFLIITLAGMALNHLYRPLKAPIQFNLKATLSLLKVGAPIFGFAYLFGVAGTFPRLILLKDFDITLVGLFAPAAAVVGLTQLLPKSIAQYLYPQMSFKLGKTKDPKTIWPMAWKSSIAILAASIPLIAVGLFLLPILFPPLFPEYTQAMPAVAWCLGAGAFLGASISVNALFALKAWRWSAIYTTIRLGSCFLAPYLGAQIHPDPLTGVALGFFTAQAITFLAALATVYGACTQATKQPS